MKKILTLVILLGLLLVTAGCTGEPAASPQPTPPTTPAATKVKTPSPTYNPVTTVPTPEIHEPQDYTITIKKLSLTPPDLTIKQGDQVRWLNADSSDDPSLYNPTHRISILNVKDGQLIAPGTSWSWTFNKPGVYPYSDMIHTNLKGTITVVV